MFQPTASPPMASAGAHSAPTQAGATAILLLALTVKSRHQAVQTLP